MASIPAITLPCPACSIPLLLPVTAESVQRRKGAPPDVTIHIDDQPLTAHAATHHPSEATMLTPTVGRIVHYRLSEGDVAAIKALPGQNNPVQPGQIVAAVVVQVFTAPTCNLRVLLDGQDDYWATSRAHGTDPGQWDWPQHITK